MLCLNCDQTDHKPNDCHFKRKVCWNCHGNHPGNDCPRRCRFCTMRHEYPIMECIKRESLSYSRSLNLRKSGHTSSYVLDSEHLSNTSNNIFSSKSSQVLLNFSFIDYGLNFSRFCR